MKCAIVDRHATLLLVALAVFSTSLAAQQTGHRHQRRYKLVEVGTFGGPNSVYNVFSLVARNDGTVVGAANTSAPDPYAPNCFDNCFVQHAWRWRNGVLKDLGVLPGGYSSYTNAINALGLIVGHSQNGEFDPSTGIPSFVPALWSHGKIQNLGTLGGAFGTAFAATDQNLIAGIAENGTIDTSGFGQTFGFSGVMEIHAVGWRGKEIFDLGTLGGPGAIAGDMNNLGEIVGMSPTDPNPGPYGFPPVAPFLWDKGKMRNLGTLGGSFGVAGAVNNRGQVVGSSSLAENPFACFTGEAGCHPFIWQHGKLKDLGTLGGTFANGEWLNDAGEVIGFSMTTGDEALHAFFWKNGNMSDLGTVDGDNSSNAFGINVRGQVVGQSWFFDGQDLTSSHAFVWENSGPMVDLNTVVCNPTDMDLVEANFITDRGWIIARGFLPNGDLHTAIL
ncbi:MAG: hypothetical protein ACRD3W_07845, partial [Terriglobales bacterium]